MDLQSVHCVPFLFFLSFYPENPDSDNLRIQLVAYRSRSAFRMTATLRPTCYLCIRVYLAGGVQEVTDYSFTGIFGYSPNFADINPTYG